MKKKELAKELQIWFNTVNSNYQNFWHSDPVARIIKTNLNKWGNFKLNKRGNPKKAYRKMAYVLAVRNGYEGEFEG